MNCKSGDLAVIINSRFSDNIGAFVRVRKIAMVGELGAFWNFEKASKPLMLGGYDENNRYNFVHVRETTADNFAFLRDADLQPIRGTHLNEHEKNLSVRSYR